MQAGPCPPPLGRTRHRHELRLLSYVTLDQANGGIIRNLTHDGIGVQAVAAIRPRQQVRVRFELRYPRLRVETRGEVVWSTFSGQCGIRFLDLSPRTARQIDEWIFGDLLSGLAVPWQGAQSGAGAAASSASARRFTAEAADRSSGTATGVVERAEEEAGLMVSPAPLNVIELPMQESAAEPDAISATPRTMPEPALDWLSQPLSSRGLAWTVNTMIVVAALLLFALVFLSVTREAPKWPFPVATGAAIVVGGMYWAFFRMFGGASFGARLARMAASGPEGDRDEDARFR
jgi:PilZ domain